MLNLSTFLSQNFAYDFFFFNSDYSLHMFGFPYKVFLNVTKTENPMFFQILLNSTLKVMKVL